MKKEKKLTGVNKKPKSIWSWLLFYFLIAVATGILFNIIAIEDSSSMPIKSLLTRHIVTIVIFFLGLLFFKFVYLYTSFFLKRFYKNLITNKKTKIGKIFGFIIFLYLVLFIIKEILKKLLEG